MDTTRSTHGDRQEDDGVRPFCVYLTIMSYLYSDYIVQDTVRQRNTGGGHSVCERSVCTLSGTSITVMSLCDIHHECSRRESIVFSVWEDDIILYFDFTPFIVISGGYFMGFNSVTNSVTNREQSQTEIIHDQSGSDFITSG